MVCINRVRKRRKNLRGLLYPTLQGVKNPGNGKETHAHRGKAPTCHIIIAKSTQCNQEHAYNDHYKSGPGQYSVLVHSHWLLNLFGPKDRKFLKNSPEWPVLSFKGEYQPVLFPDGVQQAYEVQAVAVRPEV